MVAQKQCPKCGYNNKDVRYSCASCGESLTKTQTTYKSTVSDKRNEYTYTPSNIDYNQPSYVGFDGWVKAIFVVVALLVPTAGIICSASFLSSKDEYKEGFGKMILIIGLVVSIIEAIIIYNWYQDFMDKLLLFR